jgi:transcriptional regulator with XRE-family HTH domain
METMNKQIYSQTYDLLRLWLKQQREKKGLTIRELAKILGRHHSIVGKTETSGRKIDIIEFIEYCDALGVDPLDGLRVILEKRSRNFDLRM